MRLHRVWLSLVAVSVCATTAAAQPDPDAPADKPAEPANAQMPNDLTRALQGWRYKPYVNQQGVASAACFALSLRVEVKSGD